MIQYRKRLDVHVVEHPRLDWHLDNWVLYQYRGGTKHLRAKTQSMWSSGSSDFDSLADRAENKFAIDMDTLIWDLVNSERVAVFYVHLDAVWRTNREPILEVYARARVSLSVGLQRKGIT
jgi:tRNA(Ile2) C34 agmatinyltransferase TiaS